MATCSPARLAANQKNALKSTGPKTAEGKERSWANALKHGMTGDGVVLTEEDGAEVEALAAKLEAEMNPSGTMGRLLLHRIAVLSNRLDRCGRQEKAMTAKRVRDAGKDRENARHAEADAISDNLAVNPSETVRRLKQTPEGIDLILGAWMSVRGILVAGRRDDWGSAHVGRVVHLLGRSPGDHPLTPFEVYGRAVMGDFSLLSAAQKEGRTRAGIRAWAREQVKALIDAEVERLRTLRAEVDGENEATDRAEAAERALFDPSKEAQLARKYEAAAGREMLQALRAFHQVEARAAAQAEVTPEPSAKPAPAKPRPRVVVTPIVPAVPSTPVAASSLLPSSSAQTNPTAGAPVPDAVGPC